MSNQQLLDFIHEQLQRGASQEQIKGQLMDSGWQVGEIDNAFSSPNQSSRSSSQQAKGANKILLAVILIISGLLIVGGGAFAYFFSFQSPEKIIQKMILKLAEVKSFEYSGEIKAETKTGDLMGGGGDLLSLALPAQGDGPSVFSIDFTGKSDIQKLDDPKFLFSFNIKADALAQGLGEMVLGGLEIRSIDGVFYARLSDVPDLGFFDLSTVKNQWIKIDTQAIKEQFGLGNPDEKPQEEQNKRELSSEQIEKIKLAFKEAEIIRITDKFPSEKIDGVNAYHYKFTIDKEEIKKFFADVSRIVQDEKLTEEKLAEFYKDLEAIELGQGEIWIGKKDLFPRKIILNSAIAGTDAAKILGRSNFTLLLKNFNKPVQIDSPTEVKSLEEILGGLFGGWQGLNFGDASLPAQSQDFEEDTDADGLPDQYETIYGTDPNKADTDGDGFQDGEEIEKGYNPNGPGKLY